MSLRLNQIPSDVVRCLSQYLSAYDLALLVLSGDRRLKTVLERYSLYLQVYDAQVYNIGFSYIPYANKSPFSGLRHVYISHRCEIATINPLWILSLPNELETLKLVFKGCFQTIYLPVDHELATVVSTEIRDGAFRSPRDSVLAMNRKFPLLQFLLLRDDLLRGETGFRGWTPIQISNFLLSMPETLLELSLSYSGHFASQFCSQLPRSLTSCSIRHDRTMTYFSPEDNEHTLDLATLPDTITCLNMYLNQPTCWVNLPRTLRTLDLHLADFIFDTDVFEALPRSLESLNIAIQGSNTRISKLPSNLTSLEIGTALQPTQTKYFFKDLPPSLRHLSLATFREDKHPARLDLLPKTLTSLKLDLNWPLPQHFSSLAQLEHLESLDITQTTPYWSQEAVPLNTPTMALNGKFGKLRKLRWKALYSIIDSAFLSQLPDCLQELVMGDVEVAQSAHQATFPKSLQHLSIGTLKDSSRWIMQLNDDSKNIQPKINDCSSSINPTSISTESPEHVPGSDACAKELESPFPAGLESLSMAPPEPLNEHFLCRLPRSLVALQLKTNTIANESAIRALPPKLHKLELVGAHPFSDATLHLLPRSLGLLELSAALNSENITDNGVRHLPPRLTQLSMRSVKLSLGCVASLPRSITSLRVGSISLPQINPFKSVFEAIRAIPLDAVVYPKLGGSIIRKWASSSSNG